jgi:uncharacterized membrane protein YozB (DUF420 family)
MTVSDLPGVNAGLNATSALLLAAGWVLIRNQRTRAHAACMVAAFGVSCAFLATYVSHKIMVGGVHTAFGGTGLWRGVYYAVLGSHVVLAMAIVPLAGITLARAIRGEFARHRAIAGVTWPIWMYISLTGVLVYFMLYRWFPH